jgi:hypothetical protein
VRPGVSGDTGHDPWRGAAWSWVNKDSQALAGCGLVRLSKAEGLQITGCEDNRASVLRGGRRLAGLGFVQEGAPIRGCPLRRTTSKAEVHVPDRHRHFGSHRSCRTHTYPGVEHCPRIQCGGHGAQFRGSWGRFMKDQSVNVGS